MATITITTQPAPVGEILTPYAPVTYNLTATTAYGNAPIIKAQLDINGSNFSAEFSQPHYKYLAGTYFFRFDIAELLRNYLSNTDTFDLAGNANVMPAVDEANANFAKRCYFKVVFTLYESSGANGIYQNSGFDATSDALYALNIAANQDLLESELPNYGFNLPFKFLTNAPTKQAIGINDKAYLSFFDTGDTRRGLRIKTYDSANTLLATAYIDIGQPLGSVNRVRRLAVGTQDVALVTSLTNVFSYTVCVVDDYTAPLPLPISEVRTYYIDTSACYAYTMHFLNIFGCDDSIRFKDYTKSLQTQKEGFTANVSQYPLPSLRGQTTFTSVGKQSIVLSIAGYPTRYIPYIYEITNSVEVFLQPANAAYYIAVVVSEVSDFEAAGSDARVRDIEIECEFSNSEVSHQN